jgi:transposase
MRGADQHQAAIFSYVSPEDRVPADHPLRVIRALVDPILVALSPRFDTLYASGGRPSIPPEQLLRALLLQVLYTIRSERQLMEQLDYNILFRWFVGLNLDDPIWVPTVFTKNRDRLLRGNIAEAFLHQVLVAAHDRRLLSHEHFTVDGTLLEACASQKSVRRKDGPAPVPDDDDPGNPTINFRGERRSNATHQSATDPDARLARKGPGKVTTLSYQANVLMDNRHGFVVATQVEHASGYAEREAALAMVTGLPPTTRRRTLGADKGYDTAAFVQALRTLGITPHVAQHTKRTSGVDGRTTRHRGYAVSQVRRKRVEEGFGWGKDVGLLRKLRHRGLALVDWIFTFTLAAYDLIRIRTLMRAGVCT